MDIIRDFLQKVLGTVASLAVGTVAAKLVLDKQSELDIPVEAANAFRGMAKMRNKMNGAFEKMLDDIHDTLHRKYDFELNETGIRKMLRDNSSTGVTLTEVIRNLFIARAQLRFETEEALNDYVKDLADFNENTAVLFLVELFCGGSEDISFDIKVDAEDIDAAIHKCDAEDKSVSGLVPTKQWAQKTNAVPVSKGIYHRGKLYLKGNTKPILRRTRKHGNVLNVWGNPVSPLKSNVSRKRSRSQSRSRSRSQSPGYAPSDKKTVAMTQADIDLLERVFIPNSRYSNSGGKKHGSRK